MPYMVTCTINIPPMLAYIPYMDPNSIMLNSSFCFNLSYRSTQPEMSRARERAHRFGAVDRFHHVLTEVTRSRCIFKPRQLATLSWVYLGFLWVSAPQCISISIYRSLYLSIYLIN